MSEASQFPHDNWLDALKGCAEQFEAENDDLEAILEGDIGFHALFVAEGDDPTRGVKTALYQALYDTLQEVHIDADIVDINRGSVTPETVAEEMVDQIEHEHGVYLSDHLRDNIRNRVITRVQENLEADR